MKKARIQDWVLLQSGDPYTAPECRRFVINGKIFGDPKGRFKDGEDIIIHPKTFQGRTAQTSRTTYVMGAMHKRYAKMMSERRICMRAPFRNVERAKVDGRALFIAEWRNKEDDQ